MKKFVVILALCLSVIRVSAQHPDLLAQSVADYINSGQDSSLFGLFDSTFKNQFPLAEVKRAVPGLQAVFGKIEKVDFVKERDGAYSYKYTGTSASMHVIITPNPTYKKSISSLLFTADNPFFDIVVKRDKWLTDNPVKSSVDILVDSTVKNFLSRSNTPALSIGVIENGKISRYNYGETRIGNKQLPQSNSVYEIGSVTKTMTGLIIARLVIENKLNIDDEVNKFLPDSMPKLQFEGKPLLVRHLLTHTSGLPTSNEGAYGAKASENGSNPMKYYEINHILAFLKDRNLTIVPGENFRYSNMGYALLGYIAEKQTGKKLTQLYKDWIFSPLKMKNTFLNNEQVFGELLPYRADGTLEEPFLMNAYAPAGALRSTINDMLKYVQAQFGVPSNPTLDRSIALMQQEIKGSKDVLMGLGWFFHNDNGQIHYNHSGGTAGFTSRVIFNKNKKTAVVVLSNCLNYDANGIADAIFYTLIGK